MMHRTRMSLLGLSLFSVACGPDVTHVERTATYAATAQDVYPHLVDLQKFTEWSPWTEMDPNSKVTFSTPSDGLNATYEWEGNDDVGHGKMTVVKLEKNALVTHKLEFFSPWEGVSETSFIVKPEGDKVSVTWTFDQKNDFMGKVMTTFMDMDDMLGPDYEKGLAKLGEKAEAAAKARMAADQKAADEKAARDAAQAKAEAAKDGEGVEAAATP